MRGMDRRDTARRAELVRSIVAGIVRNPYAVITRDSLQHWLHIPRTVAERILERLVSSGLIREVEAGVWARSPQG
jgi:predicted transcriptional regulator